MFRFLRLGTLAMVLGLLAWATPVSANHIKVTSAYHPPAARVAIDEDTRETYRAITRDEELSSVSGTVFAIDDDSVTLGRRGSRGFSHTYWRDEYTLVVNKNRQLATWGDVKVGDKVVVWSYDDDEGQAVMVKDNSIYRAEAVGWVRDVNDDHETMRLMTKRGNRVSYIPVSAMPHTEYDRYGHDCGFGEFDYGERVAAYGTWNTNTRLMTADHISIVREGDSRCLDYAMVHRGDSTYRDYSSRCSTSRTY